MKNKGFNRERLLLFALVAVAFFGFIIWSIQQAQSEQEALLNSTATVTNPLKNSNIEIASPVVLQEIKSPLKISGQVALPSGTFKARLKDSSNLVLAEVTLKSTVSKKAVPFSSTISYKKPTTKRGTLEVFEVLQKGGAESYKLSIPVVFKD